MSKQEGVWVLGVKLRGAFRLGGARDLVLGKPKFISEAGRTRSLEERGRRRVSARSIRCKGSPGGGGPG